MSDTSQVRYVQMGNDLDLVSHVVDDLTSDMGSILREKEVFSIRTALTEMIVNAIEHGNLEISYEEKKQAMASSSYQELLADRRSDPSLASRRVRITVSRSPKKIVYVVRDEGAGFDPDALPQSDSGEGLWLEHGRGVHMSRALMDELRYNVEGNEVTLVKHLAPQPEKEGQD